MTPGYRTSEFWICISVLVLSVVQSSGVLDSTTSDADNKVVALIVSALAGLGYTLARAVAKLSEDKRAVLMANAVPVPVPADPTRPPSSR